MVNIKCQWLTCLANDRDKEEYGNCQADEIELNHLDRIDEDGKMIEGLNCTNYELDPKWREN